MNNNLKTSFILLIFGLLSCPAIAQVAQKLTLPEAIELSIKNSKNLKLSAARIAEADALVKAAYNNQLPDFKVT
ncbi:MAG: TolC family protein, partial [Ferruginibacter sp.]